MYKKPYVESKSLFMSGTFANLLKRLTLEPRLSTYASKRYRIRRQMSNSNVACVHGFRLRFESVKKDF